MNYFKNKTIIYAIDTTGPFCTVSILEKGNMQNGEDIFIEECNLHSKCNIEEGTLHSKCNIEEGTFNSKCHIEEGVFCVEEASFCIWEETSQEKISHVSKILPLTKSLLEKAKITIKDIDVIAVSKGPGSYTGIRVGVSMARALGQILNKPLIGVNSLEPFAFAKDDSYVVCPIFNARRKQIYGGAYIGSSKVGPSWNDSEDMWQVSSENLMLLEDANKRELIEAGPYMIDEFLEVLAKKIISDDGNEGRSKVVFYGDGVEAYREELLAFKTDIASIEETETEIIIDEKDLHQKSSLVALRAYEQLLQNGTSSYEEILPDYMRKVEAEQKLEEKREEIRTNLTFREMKVDDLKTIAEIEKSCFKDPWTENMYREELEKNQLAFYVVAIYKEEVIGYGGLWIIGDEGHITNVAVSPKYSNGGVGYLLGERLMKKAEKKYGEEMKFTLEVRESNLPAIKMYTKLGFEGVGKRPRYYGDEDAIIMWK